MPKLPSQFTLFTSNSFHSFCGNTSPQQRCYHKLRVLPYVRLSYRDNMFHDEVPTQRSSLHLDEEYSSQCLKKKSNELFGGKHYSQLGVYLQLSFVESNRTCMCSCTWICWMNFLSVLHAEAWAVIQNIRVVGTHSVTQKIFCSLRLSLTWPKAVCGFMSFWECGIYQTHCTTLLFFWGGALFTSCSTH